MKHVRMKKVNIPSKGIGSLINEFENGDNQTLERFNVLFPFCKIKGFDKNSLVEIGEVVVGNLREITINNADKFNHEFVRIDYTSSIQTRKQVTVRLPCGELVGNFRTIKEAFTLLGTNYTGFMNQVKNGKYTMEDFSGNN